MKCILREGDRCFYAPDRSIGKTLWINMHSGLILYAALVEGYLSHEAKEEEA